MSITGWYYEAVLKNLKSGSDLGPKLQLGNAVVIMRWLVRPATYRRTSDGLQWSFFGMTIGRGNPQVLEEKPVTQVPLSLAYVDCPAIEALPA
jgi:hypothetical protein